MKMRSWSSDKCLVDIYPPLLMCGPNIQSLGCLLMGKMYLSGKLYIVKQNSGQVRYLQIKLDLYFVNLNTITKYQSNQI